jgi:hypothetical protein
VDLIRLYIDEDAMDSDLVLALRFREVTVLTPWDVAMIEVADPVQLAFATERRCVLYTHNICDFYRLHTEWVAAGREHGGIILVSQQRFSVGEQLRRVLRIRAARSAESMKNQVEFLANWG